MSYERNPIFLPTEAPRVRKGCPQCGSVEFGGRRTSMYIVYKCRSCGHDWQGGMVTEVIHPSEPTPPLNPAQRPAVEFYKDSKGNLQETRNRPNPTPDFRRGAPLPPGEDDV